MKAFSLWQPWASAVALGNKRIETRHWSTRYRGELAIQAAKRWQRSERDFAAVERALGRLPDRIPLGAVVAVVDLVDVCRVEDLITTALERIYGNFGPGRFGWILDNIRPLPEPVPALGRQGLFDLSAAEESAVMDQLRRVCT